MKHNKSIKILVSMLSLTMISSVFVGNTLSRYVTSVSSTDNARVAVWGINGDEVQMELFNTQYDLDGKLIAKSNVDGEKIIAPGTGGSSAFSIINMDQNIAPETMYQVKIELDDSEVDEDIINNLSIQWKLDNNEWGNWNELKNSILRLNGANVIDDEYEFMRGGDYSYEGEMYDANGELIGYLVDDNMHYYFDGCILLSSNKYEKDGEYRIDFELSCKRNVDNYSSIAIYNPGEFAEAFRGEQNHTISWQWALDGNNEVDTQMGNGKIVYEYVDTGFKDEEGNSVYETIEKKVQGSVNLKVKITAEQIVGNLTNSTWKFNNTINDLSMFDYFNYQEQTGWESLPSDTVIKSDNLEFEIMGLSKQSVLGIDVLTTLSSTKYTIAYIPENSLGLPSGWYEVPEEVTELIVSGNIGSDNMMTVLSGLVPTNSPTIIFAGESTDFMVDFDFINWINENAVKQ